MGRIRNKEISAALYKKMAPLLPVAMPSAKGRRPRLSDEQALNSILFVLYTGIPWEELPQEMSFGTGMHCWRRFRHWQAAGVRHDLHFWENCAALTSLILAKSVWMGAACPAPGARTRGPTLRTGKVRLQASSHHGPPERTVYLLRHWGQPSRFSGVRGVGRRLASPERQTRKATTWARRTARGQGLRLRAMPRRPQAQRCQGSSRRHPTPNASRKTR